MQSSEGLIIQNFLRSEFEKALSERDELEVKNVMNTFLIKKLRYKLVMSEKKLSRLQCEISDVRNILLTDAVDDADRGGSHLENCGENDRAANDVESHCTPPISDENSDLRQELQCVMSNQLARKSDFEQRFSDIKISQLQSYLLLSNETTDKNDNRPISTEEDCEESNKDVGKDGEEQVVSHTNVSSQNDADKSFELINGDQDSDAQSHEDLPVSSQSDNQTQNATFSYTTNIQESRVTFEPQVRQMTSFAKPVRPVAPSVKSGEQISENKLQRPKSAYKSRTVLSPCTDGHYASTGSTGNMKIINVDSEGSYIQLVNDDDQDFIIGNHTIRQVIGGNPVSIFRFPLYTVFPKKSTITLWSGSSDKCLHFPPANFCLSDESKWSSGIKCTTILCSPNGQAISWFTPLHRFGKSLSASSDSSSRPRTADSVLLSGMKYDDFSIDSSDCSEKIPAKKCENSKTFTMDRYLNNRVNSNKSSLWVSETYPTLGECRDRSIQKFLTKLRSVKFQADNDPKLQRFYTAQQRPTSIDSSTFSKVRARYNARLSQTREVNRLAPRTLTPNA